MSDEIKYEPVGTDFLDSRRHFWESRGKTGDEVTTLVVRDYEEEHQRRHQAAVDKAKQDADRRAADEAVAKEKAEAEYRATVLARPDLGNAEHVQLLGQNFREQETARGSNAIGLPHTVSPQAFLGDILSRRGTR